MRFQAASIALVLVACSNADEPTGAQDSGKPSCASLPAERIDTIEFNPKTDCASDGGASDAGASDGGTSCNCETLCRQRIGGELVSCKFLTQNRADCAVKQSCPGQ